jgi:hypothetical protein
MVGHILRHCVWLYNVWVLQVIDTATGINGSPFFERRCNRNYEWIEAPIGFDLFRRE